MVRAGEGTVLVTAHEGLALSPDLVGHRLTTAGVPRKNWLNLPA